MSEHSDTEPSDKTPTPTTPPPPEDPTVLALSRIEGMLDELKTLAVAQAQRTDRFMAIAERCFDECMIAHQASEEVARNMAEHRRRLDVLEERATILPTPNGVDG